LYLCAFFFRSLYSVSFDLGILIIPLQSSSKVSSKVQIYTGKKFKNIIRYNIFDTYDKNSYMKFKKLIPLRILVRFLFGLIVYSGNHFFFYSTVFCWREWTIEAIYLFYSLRSNECSIRSRNFIPLANTWAPAGCVMGSMLLIFLLLCVVICVCVCVVFLLRLSLFCVLCAQYCQCIWVVHSWFYDSYNINHYYFLILCVVNSKVHSFQWRSLTLWTHITYIYLILCIRPWKLEKVLRYCSLHFIQLIEYLVYLDHF
jgi:hypothetical protein